MRYGLILLPCVVLLFCGTAHPEAVLFDETVKAFWVEAPDYTTGYKKLQIQVTENGIALIRRNQSKKIHREKLIEMNAWAEMSTGTKTRAWSFTETRDNEEQELTLFSFRVGDEAIEKKLEEVLIKMTGFTASPYTNRGRVKRSGVEYFPSLEQLLQTLSSNLRVIVEKLDAKEQEIFRQAYYRFDIKYDIVEDGLRAESKGLDTKSSVGIRALIMPDKTIAFAKFEYYGRSWIFLEKLKIVADGSRWEFEISDVARTNLGSSVIETALINIKSPDILTALEGVANSKKSIIRFYGNDLYDDLEVTDQQRADITLAVKFVKAFLEK